MDKIQNYFLSFFGSLETPELDVEKIKEIIHKENEEDSDE